MKREGLYRKTGPKLVECLACEWKCKIDQGKTGICGVRKNVEGKLELLTSEKASCVAIDPVEKKPLYHFLPGTGILSIGGVGCNFGCEFCQNWEISSAKTEDDSRFRTRLPDGQVQDIRIEQIMEECRKSKIRSIAFTYNEPTIWAEWTVEVMKEAKKEKIYGVWVSNGFMSRECLDYIDGYIDAFNIDLKSMREGFYQKICHGRLEPVLRNIKDIYRRKKWLEITTLLIPRENDNSEEIREIAKFVGKISPDIPWHISAFRPEYKMRDRTATPENKLYKAYEIGKKEGLRYVYVGNIINDKYSQTECPKCKTEVIKRSGYLIDNKLKRGACYKCGYKLKGIWE